MKRWVAGMVGALLPASAIAQAPPAPAATQPQVWQLDWQKDYCTISTGDAATAGVALWMTPGDPKPDLYFIGSHKIVPGADSGDTLSVTVLPSGQSFSAVTMNMSRGSSSRVLRLLRLKESFPAAFGSSSAIRLAHMKEPIAIIGADKAIAALHQCMDDKLSQWGVDAKAYESLRMPATDPTEHLWFNEGDYPSQAKAAGEEGDVIARMDLDASGRVKSCAVVVGSGSSSLDQATCDTALARGRFNPAIGADGRPAASARVVRVVWRLQD